MHLPSAAGGTTPASAAGLPIGAKAHQDSTFAFAAAAAGGGSIPNPAQSVPVADTGPSTEFIVDIMRPMGVPSGRLRKRSRRVDQHVAVRSGQDSFPRGLYVGA